jgi:hypothetical protein
MLTKDVEREILPVIRELGITLVPYSPLARGLFLILMKFRILRMKISENHYPLSGKIS